MREKGSRLGSARSQHRAGTPSWKTVQIYGSEGEQGSDLPVQTGAQVSGQGPGQVKGDCDLEMHLLPCLPGRLPHAKGDAEQANGVSRPSQRRHPREDPS